jgi:hypothetical protein
MNRSPVGADSRSIVGRYMNHALVEGDPEAVDQFVARVLRRAHRSAEARNEPSEARAILGVAHLFADELTASDAGFDRFGFITAATEDPVWHRPIPADLGRARGERGKRPEISGRHSALTSPGSRARSPGAR